MSKYAVLIDGAFFYRKVGKKLRRAPRADDVIMYCNMLRGHELLREMTLLRIYYYDARPATGRLQNPISGQGLDLGTTKVHRRNTAFFQSLELKPDISFRSGEAVTYGWRLSKDTLKSLEEGRKTVKDLDGDDFIPNIEQKGVDLRIGLDMARLSLRNLVDVIVVVTGDSDLVPAFKFARREGVRVYLDHMGHGVKNELKVHTDAILKIQALSE